MASRTILITGANSGIGFAAASLLARQGHRIIMGCRSLERGEAARQKLIAVTGSKLIELYEVDLTKPGSIRRFAEEVKSRHSHIDVLFNNAGAPFFERRENSGGIELNFMVYYLGHFMLTSLLLDLIKASDDGRIINMVGKYSLKGKPRPHDWQMKQGFNAMQAANDIQLYKLIWTVELARKLEGNGIAVNAYHPGAVRTGLTARLPWSIRWFAQPMSLFFRNPEKGADTAVWLATAAESRNLNGKYLFDQKEIPLPPAALDQQLARQLWQYSLDLLKL